MSRFSVLGSMVLVFTVALVQSSVGQDARGIAGYCPYGCGPYIPMITTPHLAFTTVSPNPIGATNATGGLIAGATNSTLSELPGNTDAVYTMPVWYSGGQTRVISPISAGLPRQQGWPRLAVANAQNHTQDHATMRDLTTGEQTKVAEAAPQPWLFFSSAEPPAAGTSPAASRPSQPVRTFTDSDVMRQNQQNGAVKYDGKTEKIQ